jgi:hypothetical protein
LLTAASDKNPAAEKAEMAFFIHSTDELSEPRRKIYLTSDDIELLNPNTKTCPVIKSHRDIILAKAVYRRVPVLIRESEDGKSEKNSWQVKFTNMFHMTNDSNLFMTKDNLEAAGFVLEGNVYSKNDCKYLPLYEGKMFHHFDHRWASNDASDKTGIEIEVDKYDPNFFVNGRYWVEEKAIKIVLARDNWPKKWLLGVRNITNTTNERTIIGGIIPVSAVGNSINLWLPTSSNSVCLASVISSLVCDYVARLKIGGTNLNHFLVKQIPVLPPEVFDQDCPWLKGQTLYKWIIDRTIELTYTAYDLSGLADDCGFSGPPFKWDDDRRFLLRSELEAAFFHLYLPASLDGAWRRNENESQEEFEALLKEFARPREAASYIMETFPITKRNDLKTCGEYRTKAVILEIYDQMLKAMATKEPYKTRLEPKSADVRCRHGKA